MKRTGIIYLVVMLVTLGSVGSCTYDYFVDETNFEIYVPQIEDGSIDNFYVAIHDEHGNHLVTKVFEAPFTQNARLQQGIIRFKLPATLASISCFANFGADLLTEGETLSQSYKGQRPLANETNVYYSSSSEPRAYLSGAQIYPFGHPNTAIQYLADMDATKRIKGRIVCNFIGLPSEITDMHIYYSGDATSYGFDGIFRHGATDRLYAEFATTNYRVDVDNDGIMDTSYPQDIYPSAGMSFQKRNGSYVDAGEEVGLEIVFYTGTTVSGRATFTSADLATVPAANKPVDGYGNPVTNLVLAPQQTITFTFKGFQIFKIELEDWGSIDPGPITPM